MASACARNTVRVRANGSDISVRVDSLCVRISVLYREEGPPTCTTGGVSELWVRSGLASARLVFFCFSRGRGDHTDSPFIRGVRVREAKLADVRNAWQGNRLTFGYTGHGFLGGGTQSRRTTHGAVARRAVYPEGYVGGVGKVDHAYLIGFSVSVGVGLASDLPGIGEKISLSFSLIAGTASKDTSGFRVRVRVRPLTSDQCSA